MAEEQKRRRTVNVHSRLDRPIQFHLHKMVDDDGGGRPFLGRDLDSSVTISPGHNAGVDKEFFEKWREQNKGSSLVNLFVTVDENAPETEREE